MPSTDDNYPLRLLNNGRSKLSSRVFSSDDKLYRSFSKSEVDDDGTIKVNTIRFPDLSCNWDKFSEPTDVLWRNQSNGCYSFSVSVARYNSYATPVHDPIADHDDFPNYAHVEVRALKEGEPFDFEPPKGRSKGRSVFAREARLRYRTNMKLLLQIEVEAQ
ncbi:MAG: hypothetical protein ISR96_08765 [Nitrospira sp.]|nr:hypothetical protein [Candidatus Brocadiales bacterium]MBL7049591.1 hypothetical protein [Nitrospira sp.]